MSTDPSTSDTPVVSVLIPAFNHEKYVEETILSIIAQTYRNIELIIIDDGSSDTTWEKVQKLRTPCEERFVRVVMKTQANAGTCITLNRLLADAEGEYIYLIASDDAAKPNAIEKLTAYLEEHPRDVLVVGDNEIINSDSQRIGWDSKQRVCPLKKAKYTTFARFLRTKEKLAAGDLYATLLRGNFIPNGYLIRSKALRQFSYTPEAPLEDYYQHLQLSKIGNYGYVDDVLFSYRWHENNTCKQKERMFDYCERTRAFEKKVVEQMNDQHFAEIYRRVLNPIKNIFAIGRLIKCYKIRKKHERLTVLSILNHDFILRRRVFGKGE